jgi:xanthine dehydrogenase YagS FAD-binding subunit
VRTFIYEQATEPEAAIRLAALARTSGAGKPAEYLAGGTTLVDLMKLNVVRPEVVIDINSLAAAGYGRVELSQSGLRLGALVRMAQAADHPEVKSQYPVIAQSLSFAASQQLRNMASLGGNVLQRTRCTYFRDVSYTMQQTQSGLRLRRDRRRQPYTRRARHQRSVHRHLSRRFCPSAYRARCGRRTCRP